MSSQRRLGVLVSAAAVCLMAVPAAAPARTPRHPSPLQVIQDYVRTTVQRLPTRVAGATPRADGLSSSCRSVGARRAVCRYTVTVVDERDGVPVGRRKCSDSSVLLRAAEGSHALSVVRSTAHPRCRVVAVAPTPAENVRPGLPTTPGPGSPTTPPSGALTTPPPGLAPPPAAAPRSAARTRAYVSSAWRPAEGFAGCTSWSLDPWYHRYYLSICNWVRSSVPPGFLGSGGGVEDVYWEGWYWGADGRAHFWYAAKP
jgi:hypothetical protein